jgi:hypothetical protein
MIYSYVVGKDRDSPNAVFQHTIEVRRNYVDPPWPVYSTRRYYQDHENESLFSPEAALKIKTEIGMRMKERQLELRSPRPSEKPKRKLWCQQPAIIMSSTRYFQAGSDIQLLRVNKHIHEEASRVLYKENEFRFRLFDNREYSRDCTTLPYWRIPWGSSHVTKLCVEFRCGPANIWSVKDIQF